ncbi:MaoC/PaaZ C-terminal domain-containing protein [Jatrophihabitans sp. YIM 134969]
MSAPALSDLAVGDPLPSITVTLHRADLVRYAGASGDFNVIHWNDRVATEVGLPGVIAHGMLTMAHAVRVVTAWAGDPSRVESYGVRFTRPVPVPDDGPAGADGATVEFGGKIRSIDGDRVTVDLDARFDGKTVLAKARAVVRLG